MSQDEMFEVVGDFDGFHYEPKKDRYRLIGQIEEIYKIMQKHSTDMFGTEKWMTVGEISIHTEFREASISAQLRNLRKEKFGGHDIQGRYRKSTRIFEYRLEE
jgi:hypothetical protein